MPLISFILRTKTKALERCFATSAAQIAMTQPKSFLGRQQQIKVMPATPSVNLLNTIDKVRSHDPTSDTSDSHNVEGTECALA